MRACKKSLASKFTHRLRALVARARCFTLPKKDIWDKDIDGEILINESDVKELEIGSLYLCEVSDVVDQKLVATIIKKAK